MLVIKALEVINGVVDLALSVVIFIMEWLIWHSYVGQAVQLVEWAKSGKDKVIGCDSRIFCECKSMMVTFKYYYRELLQVDFVRSFAHRENFRWREKFLTTRKFPKKKVWVDASDSVQKSSKSELPSRFFGHLKLKRNFWAN